MENGVTEGVNQELEEELQLNFAKEIYYENNLTDEQWHAVCFFCFRTEYSALK